MKLTRIEGAVFASLAIAAAVALYYAMAILLFEFAAWLVMAQVSAGSVL